MLTKREKRLSNVALVLVSIFIIFYFVFIQFLTPSLYEVDGYYHIAVSRFLKDFGPHYEFRWTQFSTFKEFFSDSDFLFHLSVVPFLYLSDNIILAAKYAIIFYNILFLLIFIYLLKKYLPNFLVAIFLILPLLSLHFNLYFPLLRGVTLANIFIILGIYFLIHKKWKNAFLISLLYPLAHLSFVMIIIFALICEIIRLFLNKEFFLRNVYTVIIGSLLGCLLHPNYPNNLLAFHLNTILVPFYTLTNVGLRFGHEVYSSSAKQTFINNFAVFFTLNAVLWISFLSRKKVSLSTLVWWSCTAIYLIFSFFSYRFWYQANIVFFIFFASYLKDWLGEREWRQVLPKVNIFVIIYAVIAFLSFFTISKAYKGSLEFFIINNSHYEDVARWMSKNIPAGETIYHAYWSDSPYFICLNPKNNYIVCCDPIYMFYRYPKEYLTYIDLQEGTVVNPYEAIKNTFKANYGYVNKRAILYDQVKADKRHFKILYEDGWGIVFELLKNVKEDIKPSKTDTQKPKKPLLKGNSFSNI